MELIGFPDEAREVRARLDKHADGCIPSTHRKVEIALAALAGEQRAQTPGTKTKPSAVIGCLARLVDALIEQVSVHDSAHAEDLLDLADSSSPHPPFRLLHRIHLLRQALNAVQESSQTESP